MHLQDKVVVVTGGNSGIGRASALAFAEHGASVVVFGRNQETLDSTVADLDGRGIGVQGDVSKLDDLERLFDAVRESYGRVDILFVNAGIAQFAPLESVDEAHFDRHMNINLKGAFFTVQKALPLMGEGGSIILNTSVVNVKGFPATSVYSASKAGLRSLARTLASELAPRGIRINAIAPGPIETPIYGRLGMGEQELNELFIELVVFVIVNF